MARKTIIVLSDGTPVEVPVYVINECGEYTVRRALEGNGSIFGLQGGPERGSHISNAAWYSRRDSIIDELMRG